MGKADRKNHGVWLREWVFFCAYWGLFATSWHFAATVETDGTFALYDIGAFLHGAAILFYAIGAALAFPSPTSRSKGLSDTRSRNRT